MKKRFLASFMVLLLAVLMTAVVSATPSIEVVTPAGYNAETAPLTEGQTFDVYVIVSPMEMAKNTGSANASTNWIYRVPQDTADGLPNGDKALLTNEKFVFTWDKTALEVSAIARHTGENTGTDQTVVVGSKTYKYGYFVSTGPTAVVNPSYSTYGSGENNTGALVVDYGATGANGFIIRGEATNPNEAVVLKVTFKVIAGATGGDKTVKVNNSYKWNGTNYISPALSYSVNVAAGCEHANKVACDGTNVAFPEGKTNSEPDCINNGVEWYYCDECDSFVEVTLNKLGHLFTGNNIKYVVVPNCIDKGSQADYCTRTDCDVYDVDSVTPVDALGHNFSNRVYDAPDCDDDGYEYFTCVCDRISVDGSKLVSGVFYKDGKLYSDAGYTQEYTEIPESIKIEALGHEWVYDRTENNVEYYVCARGCGEVFEATEANTIRYVANAATGKGDGSSVADATTLANAFKDLSDLPAGTDAKIYLVGKVELASNVVSSNNTVTNGKTFEEFPHDAHITVTTAPGQSKATIYFPFDIVSQYLLYGPTTFDNVKFASSKAGSSSGSSSSITVAARGFKLVMTENVQTVGLNNGTIAYSKTDGSFAMASSVSLKIPDCKMYVIGGFTSGGFYEGCNPNSCDADITILGGQYWVVAGSARNLMTINNSTINVTVGGKAEVGQLIPLSTTANTVTHNTVINMHHRGGGKVAGYYLANSANTAAGSDYTVNHLFYPGASTAKIGDYMVGVNGHKKNVNIIYTIADKSAQAFATAAYDKTAKYADTYRIVLGTMSFPEYCAEYRGGHTYVDGVCTFCETAPCNTHVTSPVVVLEPTCVADGILGEKCKNCYEIVSTSPITASDDYHHPVWSTTVFAGNYRLSCTHCGDLIATRPANATEFYVSDKGKSDGGFTPDYPLNDLAVAYSMAAKCSGPATIYVVGTITVPNNYSGSSNHSVFAEPAHSNVITVTGYNNSGVIKFPTDNFGRMIYALNGDTTFENIEFSAWGYSADNGYSYIAAQHHHLTLGENITIDFMRNSNAVYNTCSLIILGGCYHANYSVNGSKTADRCPGGDNHVTFKSGSYYEFIAGSVFALGTTKNHMQNDKACNAKNCTFTVEVLGDVTFRDYFVLGGYEQSSGDIILTLDGNLSVGSYFSVTGVPAAQKCSYDDDENGTVDADEKAFFVENRNHIGDVKNVTLKILDGSIFVQNFESSASAATYRPIGASVRGEFTSYEDAEFEYKVWEHLDSLTVFYDPANAAAKSTALRFRGTVPSADIIAIEGNQICSGNANGIHGNVVYVDTIESTCAEQGYVLNHCNDCGLDYVAELLDIVEHEFGDAVIASEANCVNPQIKKLVCEVCSFTQYVVGDVAATGVHDFDENNVCKSCFQSKEDLCGDSHNYVLLEAGVSTGCGTGDRYECTECGKEEFVITGTSNHNFGKFTVTVEPTETEPGVKTRKCKACGKVETAVLYADGGAINSTAIAVDESGKLADLEVATSKLTKAEREVLNALLQDTSYGSEVKVSYEVEGDTVTNITYSIPLPTEYANLENVKVIVKDDDGKLHVVEFKIEKGYIVFTF